MTDFAYTGSVQEFICPYSGVYKLTVSGGCGGGRWGGVDTDCSRAGGKSIGYKKLKKGTTLYICVGGRGYGYFAYDADVNFTGGYNGGGSGMCRWYHGSDQNFEACGSSGGGATHIATTNRGILSNYKDYQDEVLIVAGGAGGSGFYNGREPGWLYELGGAGGGTSGGSSGSSSGGTQTSGYSFGQGQNTLGCSGYYDYASAGAGGGWYGGYAGTTSNYRRGGGGGSGYIGGVPTFSFRDVEYASSMENGAADYGHGSASIELVVKSFPELFYDTNQLEGMYFDNEEVEAMYFNGTPLD